MVELAVSLVLLLIVLAGIFDLGRAIITYFILQDAGEEGIVYGMSFPTDCNQIDLRIRDNIDENFVTSSVIVNVGIQSNDMTTYIPCYSIPYAQVYAGKIMHITITDYFQITMPFLTVFINTSGCPSDTPNCIPLVITTNGIILRPPPPT